MPGHQVLILFIVFSWGLSSVVELLLSSDEDLVAQFCKHFYEKVVGKAGA